MFPFFNPCFFVCRCSFCWNSLENSAWHGSCVDISNLCCQNQHLHKVAFMRCWGQHANLVHLGHSPPIGRAEILCNFPPALHMDEYLPLCAGPVYASPPMFSISQWLNRSTIRPFDHSLHFCCCCCYCCYFSPSGGRKVSKMLQTLWWWPNFRRSHF